MDTGFRGFDRAMPDFLASLKANNDKAWFDANRVRFEAVCVKPCLDLIESLTLIVEGFDPPHRGEARVNGSLRRIFRDTRFSQDKTPYHTFVHLIFWAGDHPIRSPGLHLVFSPGGFGLGAGHWGFSPAQLANYRRALCKTQEVEALEGALLLARQAGCHLETPALKKPPKGFTFAEGVGKFPLQKGIVVRNRNEPYGEDMFGNDCIPSLVSRLEKLLPLQKWLMENVYE